MKDKIKFTWQENPEEDRPGNNNDASEKVMFGGCGVFYGPIRGPAATRARHPKRTFWSLFGFGRKENIAEDA